MESMLLWGLSIDITKYILWSFLIEMYLLGVAAGNAKSMEFKSGEPEGSFYSVKHC